ncbi:hypothetical protein LWI29_015184 [Acer saccharum]|uniref:Uncharacterized protein n=1 Tax=Acer saccharum TaxID=4024 RepID=A0AA39RDS7_ACESA|nr:hypothetical protein LWI29_015184 [Acer saccharum]
MDPSLAATGEYRGSGADRSHRTAARARRSGGGDQVVVASKKELREACGSCDGLSCCMEVSKVSEFESLSLDKTITWVHFTKLNVSGGCL